jgi:hypothetical protein
MTLVLQIAGGIILAVIAIAVAPIVLGGALGAMAHVIVALTKPRRGLLVPVPGQTRKQWVKTSLLQLGGVGVAFGVLALVGYLSRHSAVIPLSQ